MRVKEDLIITSMSLGDYVLQVPDGLSELLNRAGAWKYIEPDLETIEESPLENYDRKVVKEEGTLRTILTYKLPSEDNKQNKKVS